MDFRGASQAEMEGWVAEERVYGELRGVAQPGGTLGRGLTHWLEPRRPPKRPNELARLRTRPQQAHLATIWLSGCAQEGQWLG